jgi:hypothetical protein
MELLSVIPGVVGDTVISERLVLHVSQISPVHPAAGIVDHVAEVTKRDVAVIVALGAGCVKSKSR